MRTLVKTWINRQLPEVRENVSIKNVSSPGNIYLFNDDNRNTRKRCEIGSKLTIKTPERRH